MSEQTKPPIGLKPKWIWDKQRKNAIISAIDRYISADKKIPLECVEEYNNLVKEVE